MGTNNNVVCYIIYKQQAVVAMVILKICTSAIPKWLIDMM